MGKRIYLFDNLKALLIVLVVIGHLADTYIKAPYFKSIYVFIYAFHMPLFIFISGFFHKNEDIKRKITVYFALGYILKIIDFLTLSALNGKTRFTPFSEDGAPWFLFALCAYIGITYLFRHTDLRLLLAASIVFGCFSGYYESIGDFLVLSRILVFYPYYILGIIFSGLDIKRLSKVYHKLHKSILIKYLAMAIIVVWIYWCFGETDITYKFRRLFTGRNSFGEQFREYGCVYRLFCYVLALLIGCAIVILLPEGKVKYISELGTRTLQIYFWHWPLIFVIQKLVPISVICKDLYGQMRYLLLTFPIVIILSSPIFKYPTKWIIKYRHGILDKPENGI